MPDTKITALTAIGANPIIPATFPIPMVDLTDTSMAASGTTKKVTVNQILGAGGTATLASATITGDLTVDTSTLKVDSANNRVGVGTASPLVPLHVETTGTSTSAFGNVVATFRSQAAGRDSTLQFSDGTNQAVISMLSGALSFGTAGSNTRYQIDGTGVSTWSVAGTTAMTLNSTGLGVGGSPNERFNVFGTCNTFGDSRFNVAFFDTASATTGTGAGLAFSGYTNGTTGGSTFGQIKGIKENSTAGNTAGALVFSTTANAANPTERLRIDSSGNVGIGGTSTLTAAGRGNVSINGSTDSILVLQNAGATAAYAVADSTGLEIAASGSRRILFVTNSISRMRVKENGQVRFMPLAADPAGAEAGDVYYNSTSNKLKCYNGTTWNDLF